MPTINDANGQNARVDSDGHLRTHATTQDEALAANKRGDAYAILIDVTPASTDDDFFYLKNKENRNLIFYQAEGWADDTLQEVSIVVGGTDAGQFAAGDTVVPGNMNSGSGKVLDADCVTDATDLAVTGGTALILLSFPITASDPTQWKFPGGIILQPNQRIHFQAALTGLINMTLYCYLEE